VKRGRHAVPRSVSLFRSLVYFVPSYALAIGGYLAVNVIAARILNTADFGYFVLVVTATILIGQLSLLGVHRAGVREAANAESAETLSELRRGVRAVILIPVPLAAVATACSVWFLRGSEASDIPTAMLSGVLVLGAGYQKVTANFLRGLGHVHAATLVTGRSGGVLVALVQAGCMLLVAVLNPGLGLPGVLACTAAGYLLPLTWAWWLLRSSWPHVGGREGILQDLKRVLQRDWRFSLSQTGGFLNSNVELWLAGAVLSAGGTSLFASGQRLSNLLLIPSTSLGTVFSPALARLAKKDDEGVFEPLVRTASTVATVASGALWVPMVLAPGLSLTIVFGADFAPAATALMFLATGFLLNSVSGLSATTLSMAHHESDVALINWCAVAVRVVAGVVCARAWGVNGLAASSAIIAAAVYMASWHLVRRRLSVSTHATLRPRLSLLRRIPG
jgi:O-antigen/teichoic acid export membrane protein